MGVVYQSYDSFLGRDVAIKVALAESLRDRESGEQYRKMFFQRGAYRRLIKTPEYR